MVFNYSGVEFVWINMLSYLFTDLFRIFFLFFSVKFTLKLATRLILRHKDNLLSN